MEAHDACKCCEQSPSAAAAAEAQSPTPDEQTHTLIDADIERRKARCSWKQMDLCFRWKHVQAFIEGQGRGQDAELLAELRTCLRGNQLKEVEFDGARIVRLNHKGM